MTACQGAPAEMQGVSYSSDCSMTGRIVSAVEAGACPHTVIREDPTLNIEAADELERRFPGVELILLESGGDNLASTFSRDLTDFWMFVIDVAGGDDIPRKRGLGVLQSDLLVINKVDLAPMVGASLDVMERDAKKMRGERPFVMVNGDNLYPREGIAALLEQERTTLLGFERTALVEHSNIAAERVAAFAIVEHEDAFIDLAFELGGVQGMTAEDVKL